MALFYIEYEYVINGNPIQKSIAITDSDAESAKDQFYDYVTSNEFIGHDPVILACYKLPEIEG